MTLVARLGITALLGLLLTVGPVGSQPPGHLQPGSDPTVLPGPVLIADRGNDRLVLVDPEGRVLWTFPAPGELPSGDAFKVADEAFYTPDRKPIISIPEDDFP